MTLKKVLINLAVIGVWTGIGLFVFEFGARLVLNPADYLSLEMVKDDILGAVPSASTRAGFDHWGYRNRTVPDHADIVAIGDSHTYGNTARMADAWPYVLGQLSGKSVYNMGLGGYGPNQYSYLLKTKALSLNPRTIVCGLYMGDDFENAYSITYGLNYWAYLRELPAQNVNADIWDTPARSSWQQDRRVWLSRHSVLYQIMFHGSLLGRLQGEAQIKGASQFSGNATSLSIPEKHILEAFRPEGILRRLDQDNPNIREGMRITFKLLKEMDENCRQKQIQFVVAVIPTKEMVFSDYDEHNSAMPLGGVIDRLLANERVARAKTFQFLSDAGISYVDTLPHLKGSVEHELYARTAADMHPGKNGYKVIAESVYERLKQDEAKK